MRAKQCLCIINHRLLDEDLAADRFEGGGSVVVDLVLYVRGGSVLVFLLVLSCFAIILTRKRVSIALLLLSSGCLVTVHVL